ncbi:hypothetical protein BJV82DRAFT_42361 [Fennellomyces sp. T-0311]|nr:hypothetical protein BJV82DRAFT_42361 [Fennellomyces sp. T-0311]
MEEVTLSINRIDFNLFRQQLEQLDASLKANNCHQVIRDASAAIDQVFQSQLLILFDIRAHAHAKQGHHDAACADAEQMIKYAPEIGAGYARKGDVHSMFGRQTRAIDVYGQGLEKAASDHSQIDRLTAGKTTATLKSETRVDYLEKLPIELANNIILRLSQKDKSTCLSVSRTWRKRTMNYSVAWTDLVINGDEKDLQLVNVLPDIGRHIEKLEVNTNNDQLRSGCLHRMITQHFPEIRSLKMTGNAYFIRMTVI